MIIKSAFIITSIFLIFILEVLTNLYPDNIDYNNISALLVFLVMLIPIEILLYKEKKVQIFFYASVLFKLIILIFLFILNINFETTIFLLNDDLMYHYSTIENIITNQLGYYGWDIFDFNYNYYFIIVENIYNSFGVSLISGRLVNILLSSITSLYIYKILHLYIKNLPKASLILIFFFPELLYVSIFLFKDIFVLFMLTISIYLFLSTERKYHFFSFSLALSINFIRGGLGYTLIIPYIFSYFDTKNFKNISLFSFMIFMYIGIGFISLSSLFFEFLSSDLVYKINFYINLKETNLLESSGLLNSIQLKSDIHDIWKIPINVLLVPFIPINIFKYFNTDFLLAIFGLTRLFTLYLYWSVLGKILLSTTIKKSFFYAIYIPFFIGLLILIIFVPGIIRHSVYLTSLLILIYIYLPTNKYFNQIKKINIFFILLLLFIYLIKGT